MLLFVGMTLDEPLYYMNLTCILARTGLRFYLIFTHSLKACHGSEKSFGEDRRASFGSPTISVWSPSAQNAKLPLTMPEVGGKDCFGTERDEDLLVTNSELAAGAVSSILRDSDLKKVDAMSVEEALALSLQGGATVYPDALICLFHRCFKLSLNFISFL